MLPYDHALDSGGVAAMDMGDLGVRPFVAEVWGTAADWAGAFGTTLAAVVAVGIYAWDRRASARVQAQQIIFRASADGSVLIRNMSDLPVFRVKLVWKVRLLIPDPEMLPGGARIVEKAIAGSNEHWDVLEPKAEKSVLNLREQPMEIIVMLKPRLTLQDVRGQVWEIRDLDGRNRKPRKSPGVGTVLSRVGRSILLAMLRAGSAGWYFVDRVRTRAKGRRR